MIICQGIKADLDQSNSKNATMFYMQIIYELRANKFTAILRKNWLIFMYFLDLSIEANKRWLLQALWLWAACKEYDTTFSFSNSDDRSWQGRTINLLLKCSNFYYGLNTLQIFLHYLFFHIGLLWQYKSLWIQFSVE